MPQPSVRQFMDTDVPTLSASTDIHAAVVFLLDHHVTGAPVLDEAGVVVGILTEKDCLRLLTLGTENGQPVRGSVGDFMTANPVTVSPDMNVYYVAGLFLHHAFRRLPVVQGKKLVGAITRFDVLRAIRALDQA
ncbi:MAG: CBS domain-containing protein [Proteobacteria bacterium]|nr:CBS domain-containing protein [Pseudomonadota bacterium]MCP4918557.1 CBS domain-containing protein [Pseudomonadota bacterium]